MALSLQLTSQLTQLGTLAYDNGAHIAQRLEGSGWRYVLPTELDLGDVAFDGRGYFKGDWGASAFVAFDGERVAVVFRGTEGFISLDSISDLQIALGRTPDQASSFTSLIEGVTRFIQTEGSAGYGATALTAGHSLGGALAELAWSTHDIFSGGVGFGSPGQLPLAANGNAHDASFVHITRWEDAIGALRLNEHDGITIGFADDNFSDDPVAIAADFGGGSHNHILYATEIDFLASSPISAHFPSGNLEVRIFSVFGANVSGAALGAYDAFLGSSTADFVDGTGFGNVLRVEGLTGDDQLRGSSFGDFLSGGHDDDTINAGGGSDSLWGGADNDTLRGEAGEDFLEGGAGDDLLAGGSGGDSYSIGLSQGADRVDDAGGSGTDVLRLFTGDLYTAISDDWFTRSGNDLLVNVPGGIQLRIANMGSSAGQIETVQLFIGDAESQSATRDLVQIWQSLAPLPTPDEPGVTGDSDAPEPDAPGSGFTYTGTSVQDLFLGTANRDVARGLGGVDALAGDAGDDVLLGNADPDALNGGIGDDLLVDDDEGNLSVDNLSGGTGDDSLVFYGAPEGGTDVGDGGSGQDVLLVDLTNSNDDWNLRETNGVYIVSPDEASDGGEIEVENVEIVAVLFGDGADFAHGDTGQYYFTGGGGDDQLTSEASNDYLAGEDGDDRLNGGAGEDWIDGGDGNDRATLDLSGYGGNLTFIARDAARSTGFTFENGSHVRNIERIDLTTGSGNDRIWLGQYDDSVVTGAGADFVQTEGRGHDSLDLGEGVDRLVIDYSWSTTRVGSTSSAEGNYSFFVGSSAAAAVDRITATGVESVDVTGGSGHDPLRGGAGDDILRGGAGDDLLRGYAGNDFLQGGAGDDLLNIGAGIDWADGGSGIDDGAIDTSASAAPLIFNALTAATATGLTLANGTHVRNIERWNIDSGAGDDVITVGVDGQADVDTRTGIDHLIVDHSGSDVGLFALYSTQFVVPSYLVSTDANFELSADRIWGRGIDRVTVYGGSGGDMISGLALADALYGNGGADVLDGGAGADVLDGGAGSDTMAGGEGNDVFAVDDANDVVTEASATGGVDRVDARVSYILGANVENLSLKGTAAINSTGNALANVLVGNGAANRLDGKAGADTMTGYAGNDVYIVDDAGDVVTEGSSVGGIDRVEVRFSYTLGTNLENLTLKGASAINATGNTLANALVGNGAANILDGKEGADAMTGYAGDDVYLVDHSGDVVTEGSASGGVDRVEARVSFTLGTNVENLTLKGTSPINATGNTLSNILIGNSAANILDGKGGADVMTGYGGNDVYVVNSAGDVVTEGSTSGGVDQVNASVSFTLGTNVEKLLLTGSGAINGAGNTLANTLTGNSGANVLNGLTGADTLAGGAGADTFVFNTALGASNRDNITDFVHDQDLLHLENGVFTALGATGVLAAAAFHTGAAAVDASDRIIYNSVTGALLYDADGNGAGAAIQFATLGAGLWLTNTDFLVI